MNITGSLLYLLLLYAVLDKDRKLSLTNGLVIAFVVMLLNCYYGRRCCGTLSSSCGNQSSFSSLNGF